MALKPWVAATSRKFGHGVAEEMGNDHDTYDTDQLMAAMSRLTLNIFTHHPTIIRAISSEGAGDVDHPSQNGKS